MDFHIKVGLFFWGLLDKPVFWGSFGQILGKAPKNFRAFGAKTLGGSGFDLGPPASEKSIYAFVCIKKKYTHTFFGR